MTYYGLKHLRFIRLHRVGAAVALFSYLAAVIGFPLPATRKDTSLPFPCQEHACGCQSAEECWSSCCCFSPEERWAWAEAHHVVPPDYAERPAAKASDSVRLCDREEEHDEAPAACCGHGHAQHGSCCAKGSATTSHPGCCSHEEHEDNSAAASETEDRSSVRWVVGVSALRCKGLSTIWVGSGAVLLVPPAVNGLPYRVRHDALANRDTFAVRVARTPPSPPPRLDHV
jgi:hypothetical protein